MSEAEARAPFWGPIDSNINWCEEDYVITPYIAGE